jgi:hypothetical protein
LSAATGRRRKVKACFSPARASEKGKTLLEPFSGKEREEPIGVSTVSLQKRQKKRFPFFVNLL